MAKHTKIIRTGMGKFLGRLQAQFLYIVAFSAFFIFMGQAIPNFYLKYLDQREYYRIALPITVDADTYTPCSPVLLSPRVHSEISALSHVRIKLILVTVDSTNLVVSDIDSQYTIDATPNDGEIIPSVLKLPCELNDGIYFYKGSVVYEYLGIEKSFEFYTEQFNVLAEKVSN